MLVFGFELDTVALLDAQRLDFGPFLELLSRLADIVLGFLGDVFGFINVLSGLISPGFP